MSTPAFRTTLTRDEFTAACKTAEQAIDELLAQAAELSGSAGHDDDEGRHTAKSFLLKPGVFRDLFLARQDRAAGAEVQTFETDALFAFLREQVSPTYVEKEPPNAGKTFDLPEHIVRENMTAAHQILKALDLNRAFGTYNIAENRKSATTGID